MDKCSDKISAIGKEIQVTEYNDCASISWEDRAVAERTENLFMRRPRSTRPLARIRLEAIAPNPSQPRQLFPESSIIELAGSIRRYGLLSPLIVRRLAADRYELIAGERRLRALKLLGEEETDAIVMTTDDRESALIALIENLQRENLSFFEEAEAYQALLSEHGLSREELAGRLSRSPSSVANRLRLLKLPPAVRAGISIGGLTERHARALLRLSSEEDQMQALDKAVRNQMNVRSLEQLIERMIRDRAAPRRSVRIACRDHRLYVNAMLDTVRALRESGAGVISTVTDRPDATEITVLIPRTPAAAREDS